LEVDETLKKLRSTGPKTGEAMLVEEVGPEEIAGVVSKWTGASGCLCPGGGGLPPLASYAMHGLDMLQSLVLRGLILRAAVWLYWW
jgi:hypothetical protein